jgi:transposase
MAGIVFVLNTGITWRELPARSPVVRGVTCWHRLRDWTETEVFPAVHALLLDQRRALGQLEFVTAVVDGSHIRALKGGRRRAPRPLIGLGRDPCST